MEIRITHYFIQEKKVYYHLLITQNNKYQIRQARYHELYELHKTFLQTLKAKKKEIKKKLAKSSTTSNPHPSNPQQKNNLQNSFTSQNSGLDPTILPEFPKKKWFGTRKDEFVQLRIQNLQNYLYQLIDLMDKNDIIEEILRDDFNEFFIKQSKIISNQKEFEQNEMPQYIRVIGKSLENFFKENWLEFVRSLKQSTTNEESKNSDGEQQSNMSGKTPYFLTSQEQDNNNNKQKSNKKAKFQEDFQVFEEIDSSCSDFSSEAKYYQQGAKQVENQQIQSAFTFKQKQTGKMMIQQRKKYSKSNDEDSGNQGHFSDINDKNKKKKSASFCQQTNKKKSVHLSDSEQEEEEEIYDGAEDYANKNINLNSNGDIKFKRTSHILNQSKLEENIKTTSEIREIDKQLSELQNESVKQNQLSLIEDDSATTLEESKSYNNNSEQEQKKVKTTKYIFNQEYIRNKSLKSSSSILTKNNSKLSCKEKSKEIQKLECNVVVGGKGPVSPVQYIAFPSIIQYEKQKQEKEEQKKSKKAQKKVK